MAEPKYGVSGGVDLSEERVGELADEAEHGYDAERLRKRSRRGRPPLGQEAATVFHVRLEPSLRAALEDQADEEATTPSDLVRQALREFLDVRRMKRGASENELLHRQEVARAAWTGVLSFGLVNVPVRLYTAVQSKTPSFRQLSRKDHSPVRQKQVSATTGEEVAPEDLVKGFEVAPDQYEVIEPEELEALAPEAAHGIDIEGFVDLEEIDPVYLDRPYYVGPAVKSAAKPYRLLVEAMEESGKAAIARFVMRSRQDLAALRVNNGVLVLMTMNYHDEIILPSEVEGALWEEEVKVTQREVTMAKQLIDALSATFEPERYEDEYRRRVLEFIEAKAAGTEVVLREAPHEGAVVVDLMAALRESIQGAKGRRQEAG